MSVGIRYLPGATAQPIAPAYSRKAAFSRKMTERRNRSGKVSLVLAITSLIGISSVDWFRHDNTHWPYGWLGIVREHPRIAADMLAGFFFLLLSVSVIVFALVIKHELNTAE